MAGGLRHKPLSHMNKWEREQAVTFYLEGVSVQSLANWFDREVNTIGRLMKREGVLRGNPDFAKHPEHWRCKTPRHGAKGVKKNRNAR